MATNIEGPRVGGFAQAGGRPNADSAGAENRGRPEGDHAQAGGRSGAFPARAGGPGDSMGGPAQAGGRPGASPVGAGGRGHPEGGPAQAGGQSGAPSAGAGGRGGPEGGGAQAGGRLGAGPMGAGGRGRPQGGPAQVGGRPGAFPARAGGPGHSMGGPAQAGGRPGAGPEWAGSWRHPEGGSQPGHPYRFGDGRRWPWFQAGRWDRGGDWRGAHQRWPWFQAGRWERGSDWRRAHRRWPWFNRGMWRDRSIQSPLVTWAQSCLAQLLGPWVPQDGIVGRRTRRAIEEFQAQRQMLVTGMLDDTTVGALRSICGGQEEAQIADEVGESDDEIVRYRDRPWAGHGLRWPWLHRGAWRDGLFHPPTVAWAQACLVQVLGPGVPQDGVMGPGMRRAIEQFQMQQQLPSTGMLDGDTISALQAVCSVI